MKHRIGAVAVLLIGSALGACDDVTDIIPGETYDLVQAEGQELPAIVFEGEFEPFGEIVATAVSGSITLRESTYTERMVVDIEYDGGVFEGQPVVVRGDYSADGQILTFVPEEGPQYTGTLSGTVLTTVEQHPDYGELTLVWQR